MELNRIYNIDCLEGMRDIPDKSIDCVICDLPYEVLNKGNKDAQWDRMLPFKPLWEQYRRITKPSAAIVLFAQGMFTAQLMMSQPDIWRYNLIWNKDHVTGFLNARRMPLRSHEDICVFYDKLPTYNPQMTKCLPHQRNHSRGKQEKKQTNRCYGAFGKAQDNITDEKYPRSIITLQNKVQGNIHPTQKPVELICYLVRTYTNPGDIILDICMGSGTTAVASVMEHRKFIGFETNKEYYEKANARLRELTGPFKIFGDIGI